VSSDKSSDEIFEDLYKRYYRAVVSIFVRRGFSFDEARDLAQATFVRVYKSMEAYRGDAEWAYLREVATRVGLNEIRYRQAGRRKVETMAIDDIDTLPHLAEENPMTGERPRSALDEVLDEERTAQVRDRSCRFRRRRCSVPGRDPRWQRPLPRA
jgi:RNA polymerase sigma factor (sigma-70 family)